MQKYTQSHKAQRENPFFALMIFLIVNINIYCAEVIATPAQLGEVLGVNYQNWLEWFIGFAEGDGTFHISKKNLHFSIAQDEVFILNHIKDVLGFGKVRKFTGERKWVYWVEDRLSIYFLILIFNGNLVLDHRYTQFSCWVNAFNSLPFKEKTYKHSVKLKTNTVSPSLKDSWFSGFSDAEGYLSCIVETKRKHISHYVRVSFEISQMERIDYLLISKHYLR